MTRAFQGVTHAKKNVDAILRAALLATLDRDLDRAETLLAQAVRIDSGGVESFLALGRLFRMRGEVGRAIRIHQNLLLRSDLTPAQRVHVLGDLAADFKQGGFLRRAIASYEEVLARDPVNIAAMRALVSLLVDAREFSRALTVQRLLARRAGEKRGPGEAEIYVEMAVAARDEGRNDDARKFAKRALRKCKTLLRGWVVLGELEAERGRNKAAIAAWCRATELDAASGALVYPKLEIAYAALDRRPDFEKLLRESLESRPDDRAARMALARSFASRGEVDAAVAELHEVAKHAPDELDSRSALGRILIAEGREAEVSRLLGELLDTLDRRGLLGDPRELA
jgi:lipopolysaccharide biosynthesis regulator YciM